MSIPPDIATLVTRFADYRERYKSGQYKETELRREFLDPLFKALGWDVANERGASPDEKDVIHEDAIKVGEALKAPDYAFRIGRTRKFFVEAKKPAIYLKENVESAFQLRSYGWSAGLPLCILTDFEEFAVYDCRLKPGRRDLATKGRYAYYTFDEYAETWDEIAALFSREAVLKGSLERFATEQTPPRGTIPVDKAFLREIEGWRSRLADTLVQWHPDLSQRDVNYAIQMTIDRIIFLRICEARAIEDYGRLLALVNGGNIYARLRNLFKDADRRYNSGLFHFEAEKGQNEQPDTLTLALHMDDTPLKEIITSLYDSPYAFAVMPIEILGQVYEQFLGKVITITPKTNGGRIVAIEDKPEVRHAGGVYYTPTYIVEGVVRETLLPLLVGKTPESAATLRIVDPACGSGSFLIGAYQFLLNWYRDWYLTNDPDNRLNKMTLLGGERVLTTDVRKQIVLNSLYGVDIDEQAVETTKLSLLLQVLEGETNETISDRLRRHRERALPDLGRNIQCGNALIDDAFYADPAHRALSDAVRRRVNTFNWQGSFPAIFSTAGGFDAVIGNPPYIRIQAMTEYAPDEAAFYSTHFRAAGRGNFDIYVAFVERALGLLNKRGRLGYILPHKFFNAQYGEPLRAILGEGKHLAKIIHFGDQQVFTGATTYTCLLFLEKGGRESFEFARVNDLTKWRESGRVSAEGTIPTNTVTAKEWTFNVSNLAGLLERLKAMPVKLGDIATIYVGLQTSADDVFILDVKEVKDTTIVVHSKAQKATYELEKDLLFPIVSGVDVKRYGQLPNRQYILFPYEVLDEKATLMDFKELEKKYPLSAAYLRANRRQLENRESGRFRILDWHKFGRTQNLGIQNRAKLTVPRLVDRLRATFDMDGSHFLDNVDVGGVVLKAGHEQLDLRYLLALFNSKLMGWFFPHISAPFRGGFSSANKQFLGQLPIRPINFSVKAERTAHDEIVTLVDQMLDLHRQRAAARTPHDIQHLERQIASFDAQIDQRVYRLYDVSAEEIALIEAS